MRRSAVPDIQPYKLTGTPTDLRAAPHPARDLRDAAAVAPRLARRGTQSSPRAPVIRRRAAERVPFARAMRPLFLAAQVTRRGGGGAEEAVRPRRGAECSRRASRRIDDCAGELRAALHECEGAPTGGPPIDGRLVLTLSSLHLSQGVFGARVKAYHNWQAAESNLRKLQSSHEKAKRSGRTHSELMNLSVAEIAEVRPCP